MTQAEPLELTPIRGGWHVKTRDDGQVCIDIMQQLFNYRIVVSPADDHTSCQIHGWCYFGHGVDAHGNPRTMPTALLAAALAAHAWDGYGEPPGYDKQAF